MEIATSPCTLAKRVIDIEAKAIAELNKNIGNEFNQACSLILACRGRVVVLGMGKSGHIGNKIAATLASTGTPAFFVHPAEASHGDLGMITDSDCIIALSYSGETHELTEVIPIIKRLGVPLIAITGNLESTLGKRATVALNVKVSQEACPLGLAPTASTTATLVMGDALAIALLQSRGFKADDFARFHPGGPLGKRLLLTVADIMHSSNSMPCVDINCKLRDAILEITEKRLGLTLVVDSNNRLVGIFTDGDLRRCIEKNTDMNSTPINSVMTTQFHTISADTLAIEALELMRKKIITGLPITDDKLNPIGVIHIHDILKAGLR